MVQQLRLKYPLSLLLEIAQLPRATFYYHLKRMQKADKYAEAKAEISFIYQENKGRVSVGSSQPYSVGSIEPIIVGSVRANRRVQDANNPDL